LAPASNNSSSGEHHRPPKRHTPFEHVRRHLIAGLLVIIPVFVAVYAVWAIMTLAESFFGPVVDEFTTRGGYDGLQHEPYYMFAKSVISFILAVIVIGFVGWLSTFLLVRRVIQMGERLVSRVPILKFFYNTPKEVLHTFTASQKGSFKRVVLLEYPRRGVWGLGFATGEIIKQPKGERLVSVFLPTTPNPTSGFLLLLPEEDVFDTNIPVEDGARLIISGGILSPDSIFTQRFVGLHAQPAMPPLGPLTSDNSIAPIDSILEDKEK